MTGAVSRESWILIGFVVLAVAAVAVSAAGWILLLRDRKARHSPTAADASAKRPSPAPAPPQG